MRVALLCLTCVFGSNLSSASAQTPQLQSFLVEYRIRTFGLDLSWYSEDLNHELQAGTTELRQQIQLDAPAKELVVWTFTVPAASPDITSMVDLQNARLEKYRVNLDTAGQAGQTITFMGVVGDNILAPITEVSTGESYSLMADYYPGNAPEIRNVRLAIDQQQRVYMLDMPGRVEISTKTNHAPAI